MEREKKKSVITRVFDAAQCGSARYRVGVLCSAVSVLLSGVPFYTVYRIVNLFLTASLEGRLVDTGAAFALAGVTTASIALGIALTLAGSVLCHGAAFDGLYRLRMRVLGHMGTLPLGYYTGGQSGAVQKMVSENIGKMEGIIAHDYPNLVGAGLLLVALAVLMFSINVPLALTVFIALMLGFIIQFSSFGGKRGQKIWKDLNRSSTDLDAAFSEYISGMEEEKIFGRPDAAARRLTGMVGDYKGYLIRYLKRVTPVYGAYKTITVCILVFILVAGCILICRDPGNPTLNMEVLMFLIVGPAVIQPLMELVELGAENRNLAVCMDEMDKVLAKEPTHEGGALAPRGPVGLAFEDVCFSYQAADEPARRLALNHVFLDVPAGSFAALVGPSGGGKSTAGQLLARFWDVENGKITIGGREIRAYSFSALMDTVSFVFQDTWIFADSVADNITMHRPASREQVEQAAKAAQCHEFILSLPQGYDTKLGDGGHKLSGGEAQRVAIARAILKNTPIVVLDEAMAFADAENELALHQGMAQLLRGKTVLMIAHRLYSIQHADRIFVLDGGKLAEAGTHSELLQRQGLYAQLWHTQNDTEQWQMKGGAQHA